jgi:hypothetical protein
MSINRSSLPLPLAIFHSHPSKISSRQLLPPSSTTAAASAQEAGPAAMAPPAFFPTLSSSFPRCCLHQHSPSHGNQQPWRPPSQASLPSSAALPWMKPGAPSSFSTAVGTPTPPSAPHPSRGGRRALCSSFGERLQQGAFFPSGASALPPQRPFFFHGLQQLDPPLHGASFIFQSRRSSSSWRPHSLLHLLSASSHPPKTASAGAFFPMEAEPPAPSRDAQIFSSREPLPMGATPCSFPLPAPRNCSSSSSPLSMADAQSSSSRSSNPAMACDSVSSLLACCCAVPMVLARCSTKCAATPSSSCAAGSLFGGANGQHAVMPPCVHCFCAAPSSSSFTR